MAISTDFRKKGCPNSNCSNNVKHMMFRSTEQTCLSCGSSLVFVCAKCFSEIEDINPKHRLCLKCEAQAYQKRKDATDNAKKIAAAAGTVVLGLATTALSSAGKEAAKVATKAAQKVGKTAVSVVTKVIFKV